MEGQRTGRARAVPAYFKPLSATARATRDHRLDDGVVVQGKEQDCRKFREQKKPRCYLSNVSKLMVHGANVAVVDVRSLEMTEAIALIYRRRRVVLLLLRI